MHTDGPTRTRRAWAALAWLAVSLAASVRPAAGADVHDDWGRAVSVTAQRPRVVSLAPHATELLFEAGAGARVVAVDVNSDRPADAAGLARVSAWPAFDAEALLAQRPDLIVVWGAGLDARQLARLAALAPVFVSDPRRLEDIATSLERLGTLTHSAAPARDAAARARERLAVLRARHAGGTPVSVFYEVWSRPLITVSDQGVIGDALRTCGARNVFAEATRAAPVVDVEAVLAAAPRLLVVSDDAPSVAARWRALGLWRGTTERVATIDASSLQRPTLRMFDAIEALCRAVETARD